jgi:hypothetical protein
VGRKLSPIPAYLDGKPGSSILSAQNLGGKHSRWALKTVVDFLTGGGKGEDELKERYLSLTLLVSSTINWS